VQRSLYPILLVFAAATALAVCLQPSVAEEIMTLAQAWGGQAGYSEASMGRSTAAYSGASIPGPPHTPIPTTRPALPTVRPAAAGSYPTTDAASAGLPYPSAVISNNERVGQPPAVAGSAAVWPSALPPTGPWPPAGNQPPMPAAAPPPYAGPPQGYRTPQAGLESQQPPPPGIAGCEGAQILAQVGADVILASEVSAAVNDILERNKDRIPPEQIDAQRAMLTKELLKQRIQFKLIYQDAKRKIPDENLKKIREKISEQYDETVIPKRIELAGVGSRQELDAKLAELGTSLERERRTFIERTLAQQWAREQIDTNVEVRPDEMLRYYREHLADFEHPARARWQQLTVRKASYPSNQAAYTALASLGNQVFTGAPFEEVAKAHSEGVTAANGGDRDWTTKGALVSSSLDEAVFGLPVGKLSRIIEDDEAFHIVRVIEREDASVTPFRDAQVKIKEELSNQDEDGQLQKYLARLEQEIPVWTVFDDKDPRQAVAQRPGAPVE
jgi:parvulin-like peptidyl-prolyl isomerase